ncbi:hypothetical protein LMIY3S_00839 [Labrys miyagiensis]
MTIGDAPTTQRPDRASEQQPEDLVFECRLDEPLAKVWRALAAPYHVATWLAPAKSLTDEGKVRFDGRAVGLAGDVECRLLSSDPPRHLRYAWREDDGTSTLDSIVTFDLAPAREGGTLVRITHGGFVLKPVAANLNQPVVMLRAA